MSRKQKIILVAGVLFLGLAVLLFPKLKYYYAAFQKSSNAAAVVVYLSAKEQALDVKYVAQLLQEKGFPLNNF